MSTNLEKIHDALRLSGPMCDDCLSEASRVSPRQAVNQVCRAEENRIFSRRTDQCPQCGKQKIVNAVVNSLPAGQQQLIIKLSEGAIRNGYIPIRSDQELFPEIFFSGPEETPGSPKFSLALPDGQSVTTDIRSPSGKGGRIRARFNRLFKQYGLSQGACAVISQHDPNSYALSFTLLDEFTPTKRVITMPDSSLNQILYGPPGTGKTYATVNKALEILDPKFAATNSRDRVALRRRFEELSGQGRIEFVTFHQSFSYEDFVEGLKATSEDGKISYDIDDGVFKRICIVDQNNVGIGSEDRKFGSQLSLKLKPGTWIGNGRYQVSYVSNDLVRVLIQRTGSTASFDVELLRELARYVETGRVSIEDIKQKRVFEKTESSLEKFIVNGYPGIIGELLECLTTDENAELADKPDASEAKVLIIDEINRGNIANIFGELITLIEPSKRAGADEATEVTLPYSKEKFSVPSNLHIIGTMNTADRSLVHVDTALRRRFTFIETPPNLSVLDGLVVEKVNVRKLLEVINDRIELIYDREHRIGHSYFLALKVEPTIDKLRSIFSNQIIPLLEEYFFDDWSRIQQVLREAGKASSRFIEPKFTESDVQTLLGDDSDQVGVVYQKSVASLADPSTYISIYQPIGQGI